MAKTYFIQVGKGPSLPQKAGSMVLLSAFLLSGPMVNHLFLDGSWWLDIPFVAFGFGGAALMLDFKARHRADFDCVDDAIEWLKLRADSKPTGG